MSGLLNLVAVATAALLCTTTLAQSTVAAKYAALRAAITTSTTEVNAAKVAWLAADLAYNQNEQTAPGFSVASSLSQNFESGELLQVSRQARVTLDGKIAMLEQAYWKLTAAGEGVSSTEYTATAVNSDRMFQYAMAHYPMQISLGEVHACAVYKSTWGAASAVKCWGGDSSHALGNGAITNQAGSVTSFAAATDVDLGTGRTPLKVVVGHSASCALLDDKSVKCWGTNENKQLGIGSENPSLHTDTGIIAGNGISVVVLGNNAAGTLNKVKVLEGWGVGKTWCVILETDITKCWGQGTSGATGNGATSDVAAPSTAVNFGTGRFAKSLAVGNRFGCAILNNNGVKCWGLGSSGQIGQGNTNDVTSPAASADVVLGAGRSARLLAAGADHVCAILDNNDLKCWGKGLHYCLGTASTSDLSAPPASGVNLGAGRYAVSLALGSRFTCAILDNYQVKCWGYNALGELGRGHTSADAAANLPLAASDVLSLQPPTTVTASLFTGEANGCAVKDNGQVWCWGFNNGYMVGDGTNTNRNSPVVIYTPPAR